MTQEHTPTPWYFNGSDREQFGIYAERKQPSINAIARTDTAFESDKANAKLITDSVNSYGKHCADPIAAAESDLLGQALETVNELLYYIENQHKQGRGHEKMDASRITDKARTILAQRKEQ